MADEFVKAPTQLETVPAGSQDHMARISGARSVHPHAWKPMTPGSWEQQTTVLPGESAVDVMRELEPDPNANVSQLLSPAARNMIIQSERRIRAMEGTDKPPPPSKDELAELEAYRKERELAREMVRLTAGKPDDAPVTSVDESLGRVGRCIRKAGRALDPLWWTAALYFRCRSAVRCPKTYDVDLLERLGPNSLDTGDVLLFAGAKDGMQQLHEASEWVSAAVIVRGPPTELITWRPDEKELRGQGDGGYLAGDVSDEEEARWEMDRGTGSRIFVYESVRVKAGAPRKGEAGGAQLVPLRHRLRNSPAHSIAAIRHLDDFERTPERLSRLWGLMRDNRRRPFQPPWPAERKAVGQVAYLDEAVIEEMEATRPLASAELVTEALQALGAMALYEPNVDPALLVEAGGGKGGGGGGLPPETFRPADFAERGMARPAMPLWLDRLLRRCCPCCCPCVPVDLGETLLLPYAGIAPGLKPRLGPPMRISNTAERTNLADVRAKAGGEGAKKLLLGYSLGVIGLLLFHSLEHGFDAGGATAAIAVGAGLVMALVGALWEWASAIIWLHLTAERGNPQVYRGAGAGWATLHMQLGHPLMTSVLLTLAFGVLLADENGTGAPKPLRGSVSLGGAGALLGLALCVGGAIPALVLQAATLQASGQQAAAWVLGALLQYTAGGALIGGVYFQPDCTPHCN